MRIGGLSLVVVASAAAVAAPVHRKAPAVAPKPAAPSVVAPITPEQTAAIDRLLMAPVEDPKVAADRAEAAPLIRTILTVGGCARSAVAWNSVNRFHLTPTDWTNHVFPNDWVAMPNLEHHDRSVCLDVTRLGNWSKPALNALTFRAYYIATDSGEAKGQTYELQKQDGQWMIRSINGGLS